MDPEPEREKLLELIKKGNKSSALAMVGNAFIAAVKGVFRADDYCYWEVTQARLVSRRGLHSIPNYGNSVSVVSPLLSTTIDLLLVTLSDVIGSRQRQRQACLRRGHGHPGCREG